MKRRINKSTYRQEALPLRVIMKDVLMHLYCRGAMPKSVAQRVYSILKLKEF